MHISALTSVMTGVLGAWLLRRCTVQTLLACVASSPVPSPGGLRPGRYHQGLATPFGSCTLGMLRESLYTFGVRGLQPTLARHNTADLYRLECSSCPNRHK